MRYRKGSIALSVTRDYPLLRQVLPQSRQIGEGMRSAARLKDSGCLANLLNRLEEFQQVGVDLISIRGGEAMRQAWVKNLLSSLDELGRFPS